MQQHHQQQQANQVIRILLKESDMPLYQSWVRQAVTT
jgi:hypothetical protein